MNSADQKKLLRKKMRKQRRALSASQQALASKLMLRQLKRSGLLFRVKTVALYVGADGELDPMPLLDVLPSRIRCYLPVVTDRDGRMRFQLVQRGDILYRGFFGIKAPKLGRTPVLRASFLSLVLMPLVAFDVKRRRLGMGGGFYDRVFAFKTDAEIAKPFMLGVAHDFQRVESLPFEEWDVPLDGVVTPRSFLR